MVSVAQLQAQQRQLREVRTRLTLQQQQRALRLGITPQQFIRREEQKIREQVQAQITKELQIQGNKINDILKNVNSIEQFREVIKQVPQELRQFIKTSEASLRQDLQNRVSQVENKITSKEKEIINLNQRRSDALDDKNITRAARLDAERRGIEKEVAFLRGEALPRLREGKFLDVRNVFEIAKDVGLAEEEKRRAVEQQLTSLAQKLEGGREELSKIIRTQQITQQQAVQLGLIPALVPVEITEITPEFIPAPRELLPGEVTQVPGVQPILITEEELKRAREKETISERAIRKFKAGEKLTFLEKGFIPLELQKPEVPIKERAGIFAPFVTPGALGEPAFKALEKLGEIIPKKSTIICYPRSRIRD